MEKKQLTVCLVDIAGFMKKMASKSEEDLINELQGYYEKVGDIIYEHNGKIIKYIGDAILFTFNLADDARIAAEYIRKIKICDCEIRVSIATGKVYEGEFGHKNLRVRDIFGRTVNLAATMMGKAEKSYSYIIMDDETRKALGKDVE
ncbi:MAG: adenylate/guanylate cyclase domain-containing protein [bacterium]|nr:adenylate/guanylate cyclase domain-containing protein [bacterium]